MRRVKFFLLLFAIAALPGRNEAETPSELAAAYFLIVQRGDYEAAAGFFEDAALREFRGTMGFLKELPDELAENVYPQFFGEGQTKETVAGMSDLQFFARFLSGVMAQAQEFGDVVLDKMEVLGEVPEGKEVMHVLTRSRAKVGEMEIEGMEVISFRLVEGSWKVLLSGKMKGMAVQLKAALEEAGAMEMEAAPVTVKPEGE